MAETTEKLKPTKVKYKFGADELDLLDYLNNLEHNVQSYLNSQTWNDGQKEEFSQAYRKILSAYQDLLKNNSGRFSTDSLGWIIDTLGEFSNEDNDREEYYYDNKGNRINSDDYNTLKKRKQKKYNIFSANREVANFFNTIGSALAKVRRTPSSTNESKKFSLANNGFEKWWNTKENPTGGAFDFAPYVEKDALDENGVRGTTNRAQYLKELLENYLNNLEDLDYSESTFKDKDTYAETLRNAINNLANGYNSEDTIALRQAGLSNEFLNNYFSSGKPKTEAEQAAEDIKQMLQKKEELKLVEEADEMRQLMEADEYFKNYSYTSKGPQLLATPSFNSEVTDKALNGKYKLNPNSNTYEEDYKNAVRDYVNFPLLVEYIRGAKAYEMNGKDMTSQHIANNLRYAAHHNLFLGNELGDTGYYIIPNSEDYNNYTFLAYKPGDGPGRNVILEFSMILNNDLSEELNLELRKRMAYEAYKRNNQVLKHQLGGTVGNGFAKLRERALQNQQRQAEIKLKAEKTGKTEEQVKAGDKKLSEGLSGEDLTRIATAGLDVISAGSAYIPVYGTAVSAGTGLLSTLGNFGADMSDESVSAGQMWKNLGFGLGMDVMGLIPGFGTVAKIRKLSRILKPISKGIMYTLNASTIPDIVNTAPSFEKLFTNPSELTTEDMRNISVGLQAIAGLNRGKGGSRAAKRMEDQLGNSSKSYLVKTDKGNVELTPEQYNRFKKGKNLSELLKVIQEVNPDAKLNEEYYSPWKKARKFSPGHKNPEIEKETNWGSKDWSQEEYLPKGFTVDANNKVVPKKWSNLWLYNFIPDKSSEISRERLMRNPLYRPKVVWNYGNTGRSRDWNISEPHYNQRERELGIEFDKQGGTLNLNNIRKFDIGGNVYTPTGGSGVRKKDTYTFDTTSRLNAILNRIKSGKMTVDDANQFQRRHHGMYSNWNQAPMKGGDIGLYQTDYLGLGLNDEIIASGYKNNYDIQSSNPTSGDSVIKKWTIDGIYDLITDDRRVMARAADYEGKLDKLASDIAAAKAAGYDYYLDPETLYYMLRPLAIESPNNPNNSTANPETRSSEMGGPEDTKPASTELTKVNPFSKLFDNPTIKYGLPRAVYADRMNRRITDMAKDAVTPLLKDPFEVHRYTRSDLDAEMLGERNYADLRRLASRLLTSDGSLQTATQLQAEVQGLTARTAGKEKSNQTLRLYDELAWQLEKENAANRHETAMFNRAQMWGAALDKAKMELAYQSKKYNIWDTFAQQLEYDARVKQQENKALADRFALLDIDQEASSNLAKYAPELSPATLDVWNQVISGNTTPSLLQKDPAKWLLYQQAMRAYQLAKTDLLRQHYGVDPSPYSRVRQRVTFTPTFTAKEGGILSAKNGMAIAGIRAKTADAERFQRLIKECIDRNEKALDRLSKSLYGIIRASILK